MTEDFDRTERALREALSAVANRVPMPTGTYAAVRRQQRRGLVAGAGTVAAVTAVAVGVPVALAPHRAAGPPATGAPAATAVPQSTGACPAPGTTPATGPAFPAQRDVRGSLGGDAATVQAVPRSAWTVMAQGHNERVLTLAQPVTGMRDCGRDYVVVLAAPGTTATVQDVTALTPAGRPVRTTLRVPVAPSGLGILRLASPGATITVVRGGRTVVKDKVVPAGAEYKPLTDAQIDAATQGWDPGSLPAGRKRTITGASVGMLSAATYRLPVSDFRTLWLADTGDGMAGLFTWTVPGGARIVVGLKETGPAGKIIAGYGGLLPPGTDLDDAVVAWDTQFQNPVPGLVAVVAAPRGVRAEAVLGGGTVQQVPMTRGGAALPVGTTSVRVYDAAGRLLGTRGIGPVSPNCPSRIVRSPSGRPDRAELPRTVCGVRIVVVGAGVVGLTCAHRLVRAGHQVEVWSRDAIQDTTSAVAAAVWYPYRAFPEEAVTRWAGATYDMLSILSVRPETGGRAGPGPGAVPRAAAGPVVAAGGAAAAPAPPACRPATPTATSSPRRWCGCRPTWAGCWTSWPRPGCASGPPRPPTWPRSRPTWS